MNLDAEVDSTAHADERDPPLLIEVNNARDTVQDVFGAELADMSLRKVPITIVTGYNPQT
jgi:hypothetical protein